MMIAGSIRRFSTRSIVDQLSTISQAPFQDERQVKFDNFIKTYLPQSETVYPNLLNDAIHNWAIEHPTKPALWTYGTNNGECQTFTFSDVSKQSSRIANVLTGEKYNLTPGQTVLVILPDSSPERIFLQLACLKSGLIFSPCDPKDLTNVGISQRIQKLAIDCVITNKDNLEIARKYTHNPLRPLKKGLIIECSASEPLPVGWNHLMQSADNAESQFTQVINTHPNTLVIRTLSNDDNIIQYSQKTFNIDLILSAFWLNASTTCRFIWMKNQNAIISIAPWLFGSSIFYRNTQNLQTILNTFENYPIDTFCASSNNYQMLESEQQEMKTHLKQVFSSEKIDSTIKNRWHSLTNLHIRDDYADFINKSMLQSFSSNIEQKPDQVEDKYQLLEKAYMSPIALTSFFHQISKNQEQIRSKLSQT